MPRHHLLTPLEELLCPQPPVRVEHSYLLVMALPSDYPKVLGGGWAQVCAYLCVSVLMVWGTRTFPETVGPEPCFPGWVSPSLDHALLEGKGWD